MLGDRKGKKVAPRKAAGPARRANDQLSANVGTGGLGEGRAQHRSLGEALVYAGVITRDELDKALAKQKQTGEFVGQILVDLGFVTQDAIVSFLVKECKIPHISLLDYEVSGGLMGLIPKDICIKHNLLPIDKLGKILTVAMVDPLDAQALTLVEEQCPGLRIRPILCNWGHFEAATQRLFGDRHHNEKEITADTLGLGRAGKQRIKPGAEVAGAEMEETLEGVVNGLVKEVGKALPPDQSPEAASVEHPTTTQPGGTPAAARQMEAAAVAQANLQDLVEADERKRRDRHASVRPFRRSGHPPVLETTQNDRRILEALDSEKPLDGFTFDTFFASKANAFTFKLGQAVAADPGTEYNPFFLYGAVGVGKTHLINAIGNAICSDLPERRVGYVSASHFARRVADALRHEALDLFRENYCHWDVLILDDIQFLGGRVEAQEEFFHIFNVLHQEGRQIIIAGDKAPDRLGLLEQRLVSRFAGGIVAELKSPEMETRRAILRHHASKARTAVPEEILSLVAMHVPNDVRVMVGALRKMVAFAELEDRKITYELAMEILSHLGPVEPE